MRGKLTPLALIVAGLTLCSTQPAAAYTLLQVVPIIQVNQLYDDNIALSASRPQRDFVTTLVAGVDLGYHGPRRSGSFLYETVGEKFLKYPRNDSFGNTHFVQLSDRERINERTALSVEDSFLTGKVPGSLLMSISVENSAPSLNPQLALAILGNAPSTSNFANASLAHRFNEQWNAELGAKQEMLSTAGETTLLANFFGSAERALTPRTSVSLGYQYYNFNFSNAPSPVQEHYPRFGLRWDESDQLQFTGFVGPIMIQNPGNVGNDFRLGYSMTSVYHDSVWKIIVGGGQEPGITSSGGAGTIQNASTDIGYLLGRNVSLVAGLSYYQFQSKQSSSALLTYAGGVNYRFRPGVTFYSQYVGIIGSGGGASSLATTTSTAGPKPSGTARSNAFMLGISATFEVFRKAL